MEYVEIITESDRNLLNEQSNGRILILTAPQILFAPCSISNEYVFPWISIELEKDNQKRNLNISFERLETNHFQDYHRLHISVTDVPVCQKGDFRDFPYDRKFPPVFLDIHLDVIDVKTFCKVIENSEAGEYIKDESIIVFILANEKVLVLYPHFCGSFVTTGMISARIVSTDELDEVLKQIMGFSEPV